MRAVGNSIENSSPKLGWGVACDGGVCERLVFYADPFPLRGANGLRRTGTVLPSLRHGWIFNPSSYGPCYAPNLGEEFKYSSFPVLPSFRGLRLRQSEPLAPSKTRKRFTLSLSLQKNSKEEKTLRLRVSAFKKKIRCKHHIWPLSPQERSDIFLYLPLSPKINP